jgi:hypothetical protein
MRNPTPLALQGMLMELKNSMRQMEHSITAMEGRIMSEITEVKNSINDLYDRLFAPRGNELAEMATIAIYIYNSTKIPTNLSKPDGHGLSSCSQSQVLCLIVVGACSH